MYIYFSHEKALGDLTTTFCKLKGPTGIIVTGGKIMFSNWKRVDLD